MGPTWGRQDQGGPHVGPMNLAIREAKPIVGTWVATSSGMSVYTLPHHARFELLDQLTPSWSCITDRMACLLRSPNHCMFLLHCLGIKISTSNLLNIWWIYIPTVGCNIETERISHKNRNLIKCIIKVNILLICCTVLLAKPWQIWISETLHFIICIWTSPCLV